MIVAAFYYCSVSMCSKGEWPHSDFIQQTPDY